MKKSELFTRITLVVLVSAALVAVVLQIVNKKTNTLETTYEIITFSVALIAVIMAVLQGLENARTTRELHQIAREIHESLAEVKDLDEGEMKIRREMRETLNEIRDINRDNDKLEKIESRDVKISTESLEILKNLEKENSHKN